MMKFGRYSLFCLLFILVGCISTASTAKYEQKLNTWFGRDINQLVEVDGYPQTKFQAPNGNDVYVYALGTEPRDNLVRSLKPWCTTTFEVDSNNIIVKIRYNGNSCISE